MPRRRPRRRRAGSRSAPNRRRRRRPSRVSAAMVSAPIGPAPITITDMPGVTLPWWMPCRATASGSASAAARGSSPSGIGRTSASPRELVGGEGAVVGRRPGVSRAAHSDGRPARHASHSPQRIDGPPTTTSPTVHFVTAGPTAAMRPTHSWPSHEPLRPHPSSTMCRSLPHTPHRSISTSTSSSPTSGTGTSSTDNFPGPPPNTAARIVFTTVRLT